MLDRHREDLIIQRFRARLESVQKMIRTLAITSPGMAAALTTTTIGLPGKVWLATKGFWTGEGVDLQSFDNDLVRVCDVWCGMCNRPNPEKHVMSIVIYIGPKVPGLDSHVVTSPRKKSEKLRVSGA